MSARDNDPFDGMPKSRARVLIAKDVIKWLRLGKFKATRGTYVYLPDLVTASVPGADDARALVGLPRRTIPCEVCARGALLLAAIARFGKCRIPLDDQVSDFLARAAGEEASIGLARFFSQRQYLDMEDAFEGTWRVEYHDPTERMDAIMRNVIAHDGRFATNDIPKPRRQPLRAAKAKPA